MPETNSEFSIAERLFSRKFVLGVLAKGIFLACFNNINKGNIYPFSCQKFNFFRNCPLIFYLYFKLTGSQLQSKFKSYKNLNLPSNVCNSSSELAILLHIWTVLPPVAHCTAGEARSCSFSIIGGNGRTNYRVKHKAKRCWRYDMSYITIKIVLINYCLFLTTIS